MSNQTTGFLAWVEINKNAISHNIKVFRKRTGPKILLAPSVKANAYGHDIAAFSKIAIEAGADWLCVNALFEAEILRKTGIQIPIYIMGCVLKKELADAVTLDCRLVVYNEETVLELSRAAVRFGKKARIHVKIETGNNRQGIPASNAVKFIRHATSLPGIEIEGIATHFANIEDTTDDSYAHFQLENFKKTLKDLGAAGIKIRIPHCANSAATILFPETHFAMVRPGIATYGLWPSPEVKKVAAAKNLHVALMPVLSWKTRIAQIKEVAAGAAIGYGCTFRTKKKSKIAVLPVGYYDGYDRGLSNKSSVLIYGKRAPLRGRVCMNMIIADVTDIPEARVEDEVTLLGRDGGEEITAEELAEHTDTINYEITTRIREGIPRVITASLSESISPAARNSVLEFSGESGAFQDRRHARKHPAGSSAAR